MFFFIFGVVSFFLAVVIVFTITNTLNLIIIERIKEIGTIRALGFRQNYIMRLFLAESTLIGCFGVILALILGGVCTFLINLSELQWTPPSNATAVTLRLMIFDNFPLLSIICVALLLLTVIATILPIVKAVRLPIVKALHHSI